MTDSPPYSPPSVWTWNRANGGRFASINRPIAGATHEKELPIGANDFATRTQDKIGGGDRNHT